MKKFYFSALAASLALFVGGAHAATAPSHDLKVIGTLDVPPCTVTADDDGVYDYGDLGPQDIKPGTTQNTLKTIEKRWTIKCEGETYLGYTVVDNAADSVIGTQGDRFGLGFVNGTGKVGYYTVKMKNATVDNNPANVYATTTTSISSVAEVNAQKGSYKMGWASKAVNGQQIGSTFEANFDVTAYLGGTTDMNGPITDDVPLAGTATLNFTYGL